MSEEEERRRKEEEAWFQGWLVTKGSGTSGNYAHLGDSPHRGGSKAGGGHGAIGIASGTPQKEVKEKITQYRQEQKRKKLKRVEEPTGKPNDYAATVGERHVATRQFYQEVIATQKELISKQSKLRYTSGAHKRIQKALDSLANARYFDTLKYPPGSRQEVYDKAAEVIFDVEGGWAGF